MRATQSLEPHFGQAPVPHLALLHKVQNNAGDVLDRDGRVDAVLVKEVDAVGLQSLQHSIDDNADVFGLAVQSGKSLPGFLVDVPAELGGDHDIVAERLHRFPKDPFHLMGPVRFCCVEERDATIERRADDVDHLETGGDRRLIGATHVLDAEADAGDFEVAELSPFLYRRSAVGSGNCRTARRVDAARYERRGGKRSGGADQEFPATKVSSRVCRLLHR